jgi:hypothetical protein
VDCKALVPKLQAAQVVTVANCDSINFISQISSTVQLENWGWDTQKSGSVQGHADSLWGRWCCNPGTQGLHPCAVWVLAAELSPAINTELVKTLVPDRIWRTLWHLKISHFVCF